MNYVIRDIRYEGAPLATGVGEFQQNVSIIIGIDGETKGFIKIDTISVPFGNILPTDVQTLIIQTAQAYVDANYNS